MGKKSEMSDWVRKGLVLVPAIPTVHKDMPLIITLQKTQSCNGPARREKGSLPRAFAAPGKP
jgi:hypothetical protein